MKTIRFGSRGSALALTQTRAVMAQFAALHPDIDLDLRIIKTTGDNNPDASLAEIGGLGAFTREIETALQNHVIDVAVHSLKDLPTAHPAGLRVAAVVGREAPNDVLASKTGHDLETLPMHATVGTSSPRRKAQLLAARPDLDIREIRGNVPTRLGRVHEGRFDAVVLAAAGLVRLELMDEPGLWEIPLSIMLPAPGQGALAVEARADAMELMALLAPLHDEEAAVAVVCERAALHAFGGGCRAPLGAYAQVVDGRLTLSAFAADETGDAVVRFDGEAALTQAEALGAEAGAALREQLAPTRACRAVGRRVVVTRAPHQADSFVEKLERVGAAAFCLPLIRVTPRQDARCPGAPGDFDWLVFTSANALVHFETCAERAGWTLEDFKRCRVAAIGGATAQALEEKGIAPEVMPEAHVAEALVDALLAAEKRPADKRVLLPQSNLARPVIMERLRAAGMHVASLVVYDTAFETPAQERIDALLRFQPDVITFFSPSAVKSYCANGLPALLLERGLQPVHGAVGPVTAKALRAAGLTPVIEAEQQTERALVEALLHFSART